MTETVFKRLGPYEILEEIGRGGMAVVFLAVDDRTGRRVALRLVPTREPADVLDAERWGAELQEQFCRVSRSVPELYERGTAGGYFFVAMEYLDGENLADLIRRGPVDPGRAAQIAIGLCRFLEDAEAFQSSVGGRDVRHLLHGDLTPRNVRLTSDGGVRVLDFGIAKALSLSRKVTRNDFGSIAYLSPERLETGGEMDATDGFWSIGVMLHEMLGGEPPFRGADTRRLEQRIVSRRAPALLDTALPLGLRAIVARLLAADPAARYASAQSIREDLERHDAAHPTLAEQAGWPARAHEEPETRRTRPVPIATDADVPLPPPAVVAAPDLDETTRRTTAPFVLPPLPGPATPTAARETGARPTRAGVPASRRTVRAGLRAALVALAIGLAANEVWVAHAAGRIADAVPARELGTLSALWVEHDTLDDRSFLRVGTRGLRRVLRRRSDLLAERTFGAYRTGVSSIRERQWLQVQDLLSHALASAPDDARLRGSLRYVEGHLHRINGDARKERDQLPAARQEYAEAVTAFREAAQLRPDWPDPFLGLSRTFIYGLADVERGADAMSQAQRLGHVAGERETAQLADGYRERGDVLARTAKQLVGMPQEQESLERAIQAYEQALGLYSKVVGYGDVSRSLRAAQRGLDEVRLRRERLLHPPPPEEPDRPNFFERLLR